MSGPQHGKAIWFEAAREVRIRRAAAAAPGPGEMRVRACASLLSPGTELLLYRGEVSTLAGVAPGQEQGGQTFPMAPGYQIVGEVIDVGDGVPLVPGSRVFARHPHQSVFTMPYDRDFVAAIPPDIPDETAVFANLAAVALNGLLDAPVRVGDRVVVFGQGIVGIFCALLAARTAGELWVVDARADRRERSRRLGLVGVLEPSAAKQAILDATGGAGFDVAFEASGAGAALQSAIDLVGIESTIVVLSFYGARQVHLTLAPEFHFRRPRIVSSMAAIVGSGLQPRWDRTRRIAAAFDFLRNVPVDQLITHSFAIDEVAQGYQALDDPGNDALGVLVAYPD